jgi:hypothetical protein
MLPCEAISHIWLRRPSCPQGGESAAANAGALDAENPRRAMAPRLSPSSKRRTKGRERPAAGTFRPRVMTRPRPVRAELESCARTKCRAWAFVMGSSPRSLTARNGKAATNRRKLGDQCVPNVVRTFGASRSQDARATAAAASGGLSAGRASSCEEAPAAARARL